MEGAVQVLIVDQDSRMRKKLVKAMKPESGIQIIDYAVSGYEAITKTITQRPDVVVMNVSIETRMAGVFSCKEISVNTPEVKVILYGEDCSEGIVFKAFQMGAVNFLAEEYTDREITEAVIAASEKRSGIHHSTAGVLRKEFKRISDIHDSLVYVLNVLIKLTTTEIIILKHFHNGMKSVEIAKILFISQTTMKTHISHILKKFNLETMVQVVEVLRSTELFSMINPEKNPENMLSTPDDHYPLPSEWQRNK